MIITASKTKTFIPEWNKNKEQPEGQKIVVTYKNPTCEMKSRLAPSPKVTFKYDAEGKPTGGEGELSMDKKGVIRGMLVRIDNLIVDIDGTEKTISTADNLFDAPVELDSLIDEIADKLRDELKRDVSVKN